MKENESENVKNELQYMILAYVPLNVNNKMLNEACNIVSVKYITTNAPRTYKFFGDTEKDLRFVITRLILKVIN